MHYDHEEYLRDRNTPDMRKATVIMFAWTIFVIIAHSILYVAIPGVN